LNTDHANANLFAFERKVQNVIAMSHDPYTLLQNQSLGRPLSEDERALAQALERAFRAGLHDFNDLVRALEQECVKRPSGSREPWTVQGLEDELKAINSSLDAAYAANGVGG
jgi:hypothetical protein